MTGCSTLFCIKKTWIIDVSHPAGTIRCINVGLTLVQRCRRWTNVKSTLIQRLVSSGHPLGRLLSSDFDSNNLLVFREKYSQYTIITAHRINVVSKTLFWLSLLHRSIFMLLSLPAPAVRPAVLLQFRNTIKYLNWQSRTGGTKVR